MSLERVKHGRWNLNSKGNFIRLLIQQVYLTFNLFSYLLQRNKLREFFEVYIHIVRIRETYNRYNRKTNLILKHREIYV